MRPAPTIEAVRSAQLIEALRSAQSGWRQSVGIIDSRAEAQGSHDFTRGPTSRG
ncbi:MAG: hypothetical protein WA871_03735 [Candidatus Acidiferrales bacterium]